jgi:hypothetical protein
VCVCVCVCARARARLRVWVCAREVKGKQKKLAQRLFLLNKYLDVRALLMLLHISAFIKLRCYFLPFLLFQTTTNGYFFHFSPLSYQLILPPPLPLIIASTIKLIRLYYYQIGQINLAPYLFDFTYKYTV